MKKRQKPRQNTLECFLFSILSVLFITTLSFAQDFEKGYKQDLVMSTNILTISANLNSDWMAVSYNSLPKRNHYFFESNPSMGNIEVLEKNDTVFRFGRTFNQIAQYFFQYFKVEDYSTDDIENQFSLKSKLDGLKSSSHDFELDLSFQIGYDSKTNLKMDTIKIGSSFFQTNVNALYNYEKNEIELGLSSDHINQYLMDGMRLEFQASPGSGSGALLLTMNL